MKFTSTVKVASVEAQEFGAVATVYALQPSVGIDVTVVNGTRLCFTEDAGSLFKTGAELYVTVSDEAPVEAE